MNVLIVEDDDFKYQRVLDVSKSKGLEYSLVRKNCVHDTVIYLQAFSPDKIVLDMSLPSHAPKVGEGTPLAMPAGGIEIVMELASIKKGHIPLLVLTQYEDIEIENEYFHIDTAASKISEHFGIEHIAVVYYEHGKADWVSAFEKFMRS